jgi:hypothetical protein
VEFNLGSLENLNAIVHYAWALMTLYKIDAEGNLVVKRLSDLNESQLTRLQTRHHQMMEFKDLSQEEKDKDTKMVYAILAFLLENPNFRPVI